MHHLVISAIQATFLHTICFTRYLFYTLYIPKINFQ